MIGDLKPSYLEGEKKIKQIYMVNSKDAAALILVRVEDA